MDSNWFKIWPGKLRTVASSLPNGLQRAYLMQIAVVYLDEGGLPADNAKIAFKTSLPLEVVNEMAQFWEYLGRTEDGQLHLDFLDEVLAERAEFAEKKARAGSEGGKARPSKSPQKEAQLIQTDGQEALLSTAKHCLANAVSHAVSQTGNRACARASAPDAVPAGDPNGQKASEEFRDSLERLVRNRTGTLHNGNGNIEKRVNGEVAALVESGATLAEIETFDHSRRKAVTLGFYAQDFLKWRADQALSPPEVVKSPKYEDFTGRGAAMIAAARKGKSDGNE